jgi:hypothetical protein
LIDETFRQDLPAMRFKVFSAHPADLEAGFDPHLEGVFKTQQEAESYVKTWRDLYPDGTPDFWSVET